MGARVRHTTQVDTGTHPDDPTKPIKGSTWNEYHELENVAATDAAQSFVGGQRGTPVALTDAATVAVDLSLANNFTLAINGNRTLGAPTNAVAGQSGYIKITKTTNGQTLAYNTFWKFEGGTVPSLTTANTAVDMFFYTVDSTTAATCVLAKDRK